MARFKMVYADRYRHRPDGEIKEERRPHIIGTDVEAAAFIVKARTDNRCFRSIVGPLSLGGLGEAEIDGFWLPSLRYRPAAEQPPNFEINLVDMAIKLERRMDVYNKSRLVLIQLETELDPDILRDHLNWLQAVPLHAKSGKYVGEVLNVSHDPLEVVSSE